MAEREGRFRVVLFEPDSAAAAIAATALAGDRELALAGTARDRRSLVEEMTRSHPDVVVIELSAAGDDVASFIRELMNAAPQASVVVTGRNTPAKNVARAITAGASTFLPKPYQAEELLSTIREIAQAAENRASRAPISLPSQRTDRGVIVTVFSPKGGVGTTTVATSLAMALVSRKHARVGVVDLDLQFGDVGVALNLKGESNFADLLGHSGPIDEIVVEDVFVTHRSGLRALLAPNDLAVVEAVDSDQVQRVLDQLRDHFDYVVCDLHATLDDLSLAALRVADRVVLVTTPEVPALRNLRRVINATASMLSQEKTIVVANRTPGKVGVSVADMERALGMSIAVRIPSDGVGVTQAINQGVSVLNGPSRGVGRSLIDLANLVSREAVRRPAARRDIAQTAGVER